MIYKYIFTKNTIAWLKVTFPKFLSTNEVKSITFVQYCNLIYTKESKRMERVRGTKKGGGGNHY